MSSTLRPNADRHSSRSATTLGSLAAVALLICATPADAGGVSTTDCLHGYYSYQGVSCTHIWHGLTNPYVRRVPLPRSDDEVADLAERDRLWEQRCHPVVRQDVYGVRRYVYSARGCEYGRYE